MHFEAKYLPCGLASSSLVNTAGLLMASAGVLGGFALAKSMCERGGMLKKDAFGPVERQRLS